MTFWGGISSYGIFPVINSYAVIPIAQISDFWSDIDDFMVLIYITITSGASQYGKLKIWLYDLFIVSKNSLLVEKYDNLIFPFSDNNRFAAYRYICGYIWCVYELNFLNEFLKHLTITLSIWLVFPR